MSPSGNSQPGDEIFEPDYTRLGGLISVSETSDKLAEGILGADPALQETYTDSSILDLVSAYDELAELQDLFFLQRLRYFTLLRERANATQIAEARQAYEALRNDLFAEYTKVAGAQKEQQAREAFFAEEERWIASLSSQKQEASSSMSSRKVGEPREDALSSLGKSRDNYLQHLRDGETDQRTIERYRKAYLKDTKAFLIKAVGDLNQWCPVLADGTRGARGLEYEKGIEALYQYVFLPSTEQVRVDVRRELIREVAQDQELCALIGNRVYEGLPADDALRPLFAALLYSPVREWLSNGDENSKLERTKRKFEKARHAHLNALHDLAQSRNAGGSSRERDVQARCEHVYERAITELRRVLQSESRKDEGPMTQESKDRIFDALLSQERRSENAIREAALLPNQKAVLKKARRQHAVLRGALVAAALAIVSPGDKQGTPEPTPQAQRDDRTPQGASTKNVTSPPQARATPSAPQRSAPVLQQRAPRSNETVVTTPLRPIASEEVIETRIPSTGALGAIRTLLNDADSQPWFKDWAERLYTNASTKELAVVDPLNKRRTEAGKREVVESLVAQELRLYRPGVKPDSAELDAKDEIYVNSGGVYLITTEKGKRVTTELARVTTQGVKPNEEWQPTYMQPTTRP